MSERKPFTRGRQQEVASYFLDRVGEDITITQLERAFKNRYSHEQLMATMSNLVTPRSSGSLRLPIVKVTKGVWRLVVAEMAPPQPMVEVHSYVERGDITLEILKERDTYILCEDVTDGKIYKLILVG